MPPLSRLPVPVLAGLLALAVAIPALPAAAAGPSATTAERAAATAKPRPGTFAADCEAAEAGDPNASYRVARRFLFGNGVRKDQRLGTAWLRAAASRGHGEARKLVNWVPGKMGHIRPWCRPGTGPIRGPAQPPAEIVALVKKLAPGYGLDPDLVLAVIRVESAFRTDAVSPKEAAGLMQLIPETAERFAVRDVFDAEDNVRGGMKYLRWLLAYFRGDVTLALAAYNAGEGAVDRHKGVPPYRETQGYVTLIQRIYPRTVHPFDPSVTGPSPRFAPETAELPR
ncbi:lytic transglycosylase domain-containing protein [Azospirillum halopraeferens]|uniref:lytic transglycosylase domain-containing protein n=1 Tax=Azospirillum halopraeferens TaxID=34010 RepID=UPI000421F95B|nr:lytic transglycosylase domain-containing protein [Azospirillum halopraeferens]